MEAWGIFFGLAAAACQSVSYIFSRLFVAREKGTVIHLLLVSHLMMGAASVILLPFVWLDGIPSFRAYGGFLVGASAAYLVGQAGLFVLMRQTQAARVAPLLALKIVILALITTLFMGEVLTSVQWLAVVICLLAAFMLNSAGGRLPGQALFWLGVACLGYSLSDINIENLVRTLAPGNLFRASLVGVCLSYILCGMIALVMLPIFGGRRVILSAWRYSFPFSAAWLLSMVFLFACFGYVGTVYGNILQSTRGIMTIVLGAALARWGITQLEQQASRRILYSRLLAAVLMCLAVWLFQTGR